MKRWGSSYLRVGNTSKRTGPLGRCLALALVTVIAGAALWSISVQRASGASVGLSLDGSGFDGEQHQRTSLTVSLTTKSTYDVIVLYVETVGNQTACYSITSVGDAAGLEWYTRGGQSCFYYLPYNEHYSIDEYWAISTIVLVSDTINATTSSYGNNGAMIAYAIHGANTKAPFDANDLLPTFTTLSFANVTTSSPNDFVLGVNYEPDPYGNYGAGTGFTGVFEDTHVNWAAEYTITTAPQSSLVLTYDAPAGLTILAAADAMCGAGETDCVAPTSPAPTATTTSTTSSSSSCTEGANYVSCSTASTSTVTNSQTESSTSSTTAQTLASTEATSGGGNTLETSVSATSPTTWNVTRLIILVALLMLSAICIGGLVRMVKRVRKGVI